jgi:hypothetical protein
MIATLDTVFRRALGSRRRPWSFKFEMQYSVGLSAKCVAIRHPAELRPAM